MKIRDLQNLAGKTKDELKKLSEEKKLDLIKTTVDLKASKEKNLKKAKNVRRELAQVLTKLREKEIMEQNSKMEEGGGNKE